MAPTHIEHIGIAVRSLADAIPVFEKLLSTPCYAIEEVADQKVRTAFFRVGQTKIELLEPTSDDGPVAAFIAKRGEGMHHIALAVDDAASALGEAQAQGMQLVDRTPRAGAEGLQIGFLHPRSTFGVLVEFCGRG